MRLCLDRWKFHFLRRQAKVNPRRHLGNLQVGRTIENQLRKYLLHPGRARFRIGRDYDVVVAERKIIPKRGIKMIVVELACLFRLYDLIVVSVITHPLPLHAFTDIRIVPTMRSRASPYPRRCSYSFVDGYRRT